MANLIREDDTAVYGDKGYASDERKRAAEAAGVLWAVKGKATLGRGLTAITASRASFATRLASLRCLSRIVTGRVVVALLLMIIF